MFNVEVKKTWVKDDRIGYVAYVDEDGKELVESYLLTNMAQKSMYDDRVGKFPVGTTFRAEVKSVSSNGRTYTNVIPCVEKDVEEVVTAVCRNKPESIKTESYDGTRRAKRLLLTVAEYADGVEVIYREDRVDRPPMWINEGINPSRKGVFEERQRLYPVGTQVWASVREHPEFPGEDIIFHNCEIAIYLMNEDRFSKSYEPVTKTVKISDGKIWVCPVCGENHFVCEVDFRILHRLYEGRDSP